MQLSTRTISFLLFTIIFASCSNKTVDKVSITNDNKIDTLIILNSKFLKGKIKTWGNSPVLSSSTINGDRSSLVQFINDSVFSSIHDTNSERHYYQISDSSELLNITFKSSKSALKDTPSISRFSIYKYESDFFYGTLVVLSPDTEFNNTFIDTMYMTPLINWIVKQKIWSACKSKSYIEIPRLLLNLKSHPNLYLSEIE